MYRICGLRLGPNLVVRPTTVKKFYLRQTVWKMHMFVILYEKYLRSFGCSDANCTAMVKLTNLKTKIQREMIEIQI